MYSRNASDEMLKGVFSLSKLKHLHKNKVIYFRKHFIKKNIINILAQINWTKDLPLQTCKTGLMHICEDTRYFPNIAGKNENHGT